MTTPLDRTLLRAWRATFSALQALPIVDKIDKRCALAVAAGDMAQSLGSMRMMMSPEASKDAAQWERAHWRKQAARDAEAMAFINDLATAPKRLFPIGNPPWVTPPSVRQWAIKQDYGEKEEE